MRKPYVAFVVVALLAFLASANVSAQRKFPYCVTVEATLREMQYGIARLANGDPTFDLEAFEEEVVRLEYFTSSLTTLPWKLTQCLWVVAASTIIPGRYNLRYFADYLAPHTYGDWGDMARIMHMAAYGQISLMSAVGLLDELLAKQLSR
jgi:hypothetical protein